MVIPRIKTHDCSENRGGCERLFLQGVEGQLLSGKDEAGRNARVVQRRLPTVEINNTFYQMPKAAVLENWAKTTPENFKFAIKASRRITHMSRLKADTAADSVNFLYTTLAALGAKRGPVLFQLPPIPEKGSAAPDRISARCCPTDTGPRSNFATTAGSTTTSTMR